jgi:hypothetical protein
VPSVSRALTVGSPVVGCAGQSGGRGRLGGIHASTLASPWHCGAQTTTPSASRLGRRATVREAIGETPGFTGQSGHRSRGRSSAESSPSGLNTRSMSLRRRSARSSSLSAGFSAVGVVVRTGMLHDPRVVAPDTTGARVQETIARGGQRVSGSLATDLAPVGIQEVQRWGLHGSGVASRSMDRQVLPSRTSSI